MVPGGGRVDAEASIVAAAAPTPPSPAPDTLALAASRLQPANEAAPYANAPEQQRKAKKKKDKPGMQTAREHQHRSCCHAQYD